MSASSAVIVGERPWVNRVFGALAWLLGLLFFFPVFWMVLNSFKSEQDANTSPKLFFDPTLLWPKGLAMLRLVQKKLGFRTLFDVVPLDPTLVRGSHGLPAALAEDRPILIGDGPAPHESDSLNLRDVHGLLLRAVVPD